MLSRRLLRVKVMQMVYAYYKIGDTTMQKKEKELFHSISKSHELYHSLLLLLVEFHSFAEKRIEFGKSRKRPSHEDINPNTKFIDNLFLKQLAKNTSLLSYVETNGLSWSKYSDFIKNAFKEITESQLYIEYMNSESSDYNQDKKFIAKLFEKVIAPIEELYNIIEEQSIYWNDEVEFVISMIIKTIKAFQMDNGPRQELLPEFKDKDDQEYVKKLFRKGILNHEMNTELIKKYTKNWDYDRIAFMDIIIMQIALAEVMEFPEIPVRVTLNEYIELAKYYSTNKSGIFINGILDKIVDELIKEKKVLKPDRNMIQKSK